MSSTNFQVGYNENNKNSSRVLKPPGGGSSDIFGGEMMVEAPRPTKNHMRSNIFSEPEPMARNGGDFRRAQSNSYNRLFGTPERPYTPVSRSSVVSNIFGPDTDNSTKVTNGNGLKHQNGSVANGKTNGHSNGLNGHTNVDKVFYRRFSSNTKNSNNANYTSPDSAYSSKSSNLNTNITPNNKMPSPSYVNYHNPTYNSNINLCISDDGMSVSSANNYSHSPSSYHRNSHYSYNRHNVPAITVARDNCASKINDSVTFAVPMQRSKSYMTRNPVTGNGIGNDGARSRKLGSRQVGNPVTGEGYKPAGAEINTQVPALNGNHIINKNRIPPGGFSSGLW